MISKGFLLKFSSVSNLKQSIFSEKIRFKPIGIAFFIISRIADYTLKM
jgi:hypothetical protein